MHPQAFLKTFWRMEMRPQVFVAMSFAPQYKDRFDKVIKPAIEAISVGGTQLRAFRVDISKSGDSILTDIVDGIAHSRLVLADVSTIGRDATTGASYRNGNVMYEVGLALACRHPSEVLLVRDDHDQFLFDVSSNPHETMTFIEHDKAVVQLNGLLMERLREQNHMLDARVKLAVAGISNDEAAMLKQSASLPPNRAFGRLNKGVIDFHGMAAIPRLLDKQLIRLVAEFDDGSPAYILTPLGRVVAGHVKDGLHRLKINEAPNDQTKPGDDPGVEEPEETQAHG